MHLTIFVNDIQLTNITNNEIVNFTISDKSMGSYELNKKLTITRGNGFKFNQISKLTIKIYSNLSHINIQYYLKSQIPIMHRHFFRKISRNREYIQTLAMREEIFFILHVVNGIDIIIPNVLKR